MTQERTIAVRNPNKIVWAVRFFDEDTAWTRILALKRLADSPRVRESMRAEGWDVFDTTANTT